MLIVILLTGVLFGLYAAWNREDIFLRTWEDYKEDTSLPGIVAWRGFHGLNMFFGILFGWIILGYLIKKYFYTYVFDSGDIWIFLIAFAGIIGQLPNLVQSFAEGLRRATDFLFKK